jgi:hypothetical protein
MSEQDPHQGKDPRQPERGEGDVAEHPTGGLSPAPTTPTEDKKDPQAGTQSADKRSPESLAERDEPASGTTDDPGAAGGDITR